MNNTKKRSDNWTAEDKMLLQELVKERVTILENKNTDTNSNNRKVAAWADLQQSFNSMRNGALRTVAQLKNQWGTIKSAEKKKVSLEKKARFGTGGGPPPIEDSSTDATSIRAWLPLEFETDTNEFDSDSINQVLKATATEDHDLLIVEPVVTEATPLAPEATPAQGILPTQEAPLPQEAPPPQEVSATGTGQTSLRGKKRKISQASGLPAAEIAANEIKCRRELHKIQLENEERIKDNELQKKRILVLKEQLLLTKIEYYKSKINK